MGTGTQLAISTRRGKSPRKFSCIHYADNLDVQAMLLLAQILIAQVASGRESREPASVTGASRVDYIVFVTPSFVLALCVVRGHFGLEGPSAFYH